MEKIHILAFALFILLMPGIVNAAAEQAAPATPSEIAPPAPETTALWSIITAEWGEAATPETVTVISDDVTCDGMPDYVASRLNADNPDGLFFNLLVMSEQEGSPRTETFALPFDGASTEQGLCGAPSFDTLPVVTVETWMPEIAYEMTGMQTCAKAITVNDGMCDPVFFLWTANAENGAQGFVSARD